MARHDLSEVAKLAVKGTNPYQTWFFVLSSRGKNAIAEEAHISKDLATRSAKRVAGRIVKMGRMVLGQAEFDKTASEFEPIVSQILRRDVRLGSSDLAATKAVVKKLRQGRKTFLSLPKVQRRDLLGEILKQNRGRRY